VIVRKRSWPAVSCERYEEMPTKEQIGLTHILSLTFFPLTSILWTWAPYDQREPHVRHAPSARLSQLPSHHFSHSLAINKNALTLKSTPIVALASSSGNHCWSEKRNSRLLLPTDELPMISSFTLMGGSCDMTDRIETIRRRGVVRIGSLGS
jgi:hypothetical protein